MSTEQQQQMVQKATEFSQARAEHARRYLGLLRVHPGMPNTKEELADRLLKDAGAEFLYLPQPSPIVRATQIPTLDEVDGLEYKFKFEEFYFDPDRAEVALVAIQKGRTTLLVPENTLLNCLASQVRSVVSNEQILKALKDRDFKGQSRQVIHNSVRYLRKLFENPKIIKNHRDQGFSLEATPLKN